MRRIYLLSLLSTFSLGAFAQCEGEVSGTVTLDGVPCQGCSISALIEPTGSLVWWTSDAAFTDENGQYSLILPEDANVILFAKGYGVAGNTVPTFSGSVHRWGQALNFQTTCGSTFTQDIALVTHPPRTGACTLRGRLLGEDGKAEADPIPGIDIVVERVPPGNALGAIGTDSDGGFEFTDMEVDPDATYFIRVNLPCVPMANSYNVEVTGADLLIDGLDLCIDADYTAIARCLTVGVREDIADARVDILPNPATDMLQVVTGHGSAIVALYGTDGRVAIAPKRLADGQPLSISHLADGLYVAEITLPAGSLRRLVVKH